MEIFFQSNDVNVKQGDIIAVQCINENNKIYAEKIEILVKRILNPVNDYNSPFYIFNKKEMFKILQNKNIFLQRIRDFFYENDFLEINTPTLVESPGIEDHLEPFVTKYIDYNNKKHKFYLPTSPEFSLKEALSSGLEKIFEITKAFRNNGENSILHRPEFFILEWYRAYKSYEVIMDDVLNLLNYLSQKCYNTTNLFYKNKKCSLQNLKKIRVKDLFKKYDIDLDNYIINEKKFKKDVSNILRIEHDSLSKEDMFFKFFLTYIEPDLGFDYPTIVYEYPFEMAKLSELCKDNPLYAKRFELYIFGIEIANCYQELTDYNIQKKNFLQTLKNRKFNSKIKLTLPKRFLRTLKYGLPPCSGIALGIERLFMIFENLENINDTSLFKF